MITNEFPPPVLPIPEPKKSGKGIKIFAISCATFVGLAFAGSMTTSNTKQAEASTPNSTLEASWLEPNTLAKNALDKANEINATSTTEAPTTTVAPTTVPAISQDDIDVVTWAVTALPAMQHIIDISDGLSDDANSFEIQNACLDLADASHDLAAGAPNNSIGDEARAIEDSFTKAGNYCETFDFDSALPYLTEGVDHMTALSDELDKVAND